MLCYVTISTSPQYASMIGFMEEKNKDDDDDDDDDVNELFAVQKRTSTEMFNDVPFPFKLANSIEHSTPSQLKVPQLVEKFPAFYIILTRH